MKLLEFLNETRVRLDEFVLKTAPPPSNETYSIFVAGKYMWIFEIPPKNEFDEKETLRDIGMVLFNDEEAIECPEELFRYADDHPSLFYGLVENNILVVSSYSENSSFARSSPLIRKIVTQLKLDGVDAQYSINVGDDWEHLRKEQVLGELPEFAYHGTNSKHILNILKKGLDPRTDAANWKHVGKFELVFLTLRRNKAIFHALQSAELEYNGFPVLLKVRIPNKNKILLDYDVASEFDPEHPDVKIANYSSAPEFGTWRQSKIKIPKPRDLSKAIGTFAYNGRIPSSHIISIYADFSEESSIDNYNFREFTNIKDFLSALDIAQDYGYWEPGMEEDLEQMRQEDEDENY